MSRLLTPGQGVVTGRRKEPRQALRARFALRVTVPSSSPYASALHVDRFQTAGGPPSGWAHDGPRAANRRRTPNLLRDAVAVVQPHAGELNDTAIIAGHAPPVEPPRRRSVVLKGASPGLGSIGISRSAAGPSRTISQLVHLARWHRGRCAARNLRAHLDDLLETDTF